MKRLTVVFAGLVVLLSACSTLKPYQTNLEPQANYWQQLGNSAATGGYASLAQTTTGIPVMAYQVDDGIFTDIYVKQWNGSSWGQLGTFLNFDSNNNLYAQSPNLALDSFGNPVVSWQEGDGISSNIYVKRWNGSSWIEVGNTLNFNTDHYAYDPSLALDSSGNPVVSWSECIAADAFGNCTNYDIYVKRWNGSNWVQLGTTLDINANQNAYAPSLGLDGSGNPTVSWQEYGGFSDNVYVKRWNGSSWVQVGSPLEFGTSPSLALDSSGNPIVSYQEYDGTSQDIDVVRWNGSSWSFIGATTLDVNFFADALNPSLALDSSGNPTVSWWEYESGFTNPNIYVKQWNGTSWTLVGSNPLDTSLAITSYYPSVSVVNGSLAVAWQEGNSGSTDSLYVKKFLTNAWQDIGGLLDVNGGQSALNASIARTTSNYPVVAWDEGDAINGSWNVYVKAWNGSAWSAKGGALDKVSGADAENPSVALKTNNAIHVAWQENGNIYEKFWNNTAWVTQGSANGGALDTSLANDAITPSIAIKTDNLPIVAFAEDGNILVKRLVGTAWTAMGTALDTSLINEAYRPSLAIKTDNNPIVAWYEDIGTSFNIYAKEWNGTTWTALGTTIDKTASRNAKDIVLAIRTDNKPVVAWEEAGNIYVKQWDGLAWVNIGSAAIDKVLVNTALRPSLDLRSDNNPVVSWQEWSGSSYDVWAKRWTGSAWVQIATSAVDKTRSRNAERPLLVLKTNNNPIVSWDEWDGTSENILVRQF
jgi:hypothetical protein